jgi:hypothetical protein
MDGLGVDAHVLPWMAWLNRLDGIYIAQSSDWYPDPWVTPYWESMCNGDGFFFYSPKDDGLAFDPCDAASNRLVPSIRLELFREGLEDAAYLRLLTGHAPEIDVTNSGDEFALKLITSRTAFNRVPTVVSSLRSQMAGLLQGKGGNSYFFPLILH